ncbi:hypothetical protein F5I97DRAFT_1835351 [Phlebopus sp. FC_14]|nr:hypothetical protein F5I97DRAFT_1835351 [Phlebopus sp. FC_14]
MVLPFLVKQLARCAPAMLAARVVDPTSALTRRTFLTTARLQFIATPAAHAARTKEAAVRKKATDKASAPAKSGRKPKVQKAADAKKKKPTLKQLGLPPKRPLPIYAAFYKSFLQQHPLPKGTTKEMFLESSRKAAALWNSYTDVEKQPFYDEYQVALEQHKKDLEEYWKETPVSKQREMNRLLRAKGKSILHRPRQESEPHDRRPLTPFFRFLVEFRQSNEGRATLNDHGYTKFTAVAAERWRALSEVEKFSYREATKRENEEYKRKHAQT